MRKPTNYSYLFLFSFYADKVFVPAAFFFYLSIVNSILQSQLFRNPTSPLHRGVIIYFSTVLLSIRPCSFFSFPCIISLISAVDYIISDTSYIISGANYIINGINQTFLRIHIGFPSFVKSFSGSDILFSHHRRQSHKPHFCKLHITKRRIQGVHLIINK